MRLFFLRGLLSRWVLFIGGVLIIAAVTATVRVQSALSSSAKQKVHGLAHKLGKNMLVLPGNADPLAFYAQRYGAGVVTSDAARRIRASPISRHIGLLQERLYANVRAKVLGRPSRSPKSLEVVLVGDRRAVAGGAVLGTAAARALGVKAGDKIEVRGTSIAVRSIAGATRDGLDNAIFVPLATAQRLLARPGAINALRLGGCWCRLDVAALAGKVQRLLPGSRAITVAGVLAAQKSTIAVVKSYARAIRWGAVLIVGLVVLVLVTAQVRRQAPDIGLLLAIGTPPTWISSVYLLQAVTVGALGALGGHLLGGQLTRLVAERLGLGYTAAPSQLAPLILLTAGVCFVSALVPALRAVRADPIRVLNGV